MTTRFARILYKGACGAAIVGAGLMPLAASATVLGPVAPASSAFAAQLGDYPWLSPSGSAPGTYNYSAGHAKARVVVSLDNTLVRAMVSNGNGSSVAQVWSMLTFSYAASFTATAGQTFGVTDAIGLHGFLDVRTSAGGDAFAAINYDPLSGASDYMYQSVNDDVALHQAFFVRLTPGSISSSGTRYTMIGTISLFAAAEAFEASVASPSTASAVIDPLVGIEAQFLSDVGGSDASIELSSGVSNSSSEVFATTFVPEPASWVLMLGGFGVLGAAMRRRPARVTC